MKAQLLLGNDLRRLVLKIHIKTERIIERFYLLRHVYGIILVELSHTRKTLFDDDSSGSKMVKHLIDNEIVVGIKVDKGVKPLYGDRRRKLLPKVLTDLDVRCRKYYEAGARFAKWRSVLKIDIEKKLSI